MPLTDEAFLARLDADIASTVAAGLARAQRRPNNMARVASVLPMRRQALFHVTYALMRKIDDFVDEEFMTRTPAERAATRAGAVAVVDRWQAQAEAAAAGRFVPDAAALEPELFGVMNKVVGASAIGPWPWRALAGAMRDDLAEGDFADWDDFAAYAEGAAVAPASIFIYMLAAEIDDDLSSRIALDRSPACFARDLAIFCYLVHILRDLADDAGRADRLLTLPSLVLAECGLDKRALARAAAGDRSVDVGPLVESVVRQATPRRAAAQKAIDEFAGWIGPLERRVLDTLFALYDAQFAAIVDRPAGIVDGSAALDRSRIDEILKRLARAS
jgi:phytoene synthase